MQAQLVVIPEWKEGVKGFMRLTREKWDEKYGGGEKKEEEYQWILLPQVYNLLFLYPVVLGFLG